MPSSPSAPPAATSLETDVAARRLHVLADELRFELHEAATASCPDIAACDRLNASLDQVEWVLALLGGAR